MKKLRIYNYGIMRSHGKGVAARRRSIVWNRQDACSGVSCFINILNTHVSLNASWAYDLNIVSDSHPNCSRRPFGATHQGIPCN
ncbi:MAG: hypothetical protein WD038_00035 [Balneolales bacterium]